MSRIKWMHQLFASASDLVKGTKVIFLYRPISQQAAEAAQVLAFTTENGLSISKDADVTATKDGKIRTPGDAEIEITATSLFAKGDPIVGQLKDAMLANKEIEVWRVNLEDPVSTAPGNTKFYGTYYRGFLTSFEETSNAEDYVEYSLTFGINGNGADGECTVTASQQEVAQYVFTDTVIQTPSIDVAPATLTLVTGASARLVASVVPADAVITWTSSATGKASVNSAGVVSGVDAGTATITASITVDATTYTDTCTVTVTAPSA